MDQTACLEKILDAFVEAKKCDGNAPCARKDAIEGLTDLLAWLKKGGAMPQIDEIKPCVYDIH